MKKIKFFSLFAVLLAVLSLTSITGKAAGGISFTTDYAMGQEGEYFVLEASKSCVLASVSNIDTSGNTYFSMMYETDNSLDFDSSVYGKNAAGDNVGYVDVVYKFVLNQSNAVEYEKFGTKLYVATANVSGYLNPESSSFNGIVNLTHIKITFRGAEGNKVKISDFAVTKDGNHGFVTTVQQPMSVGDMYIYESEGHPINLSKVDNDTVIKYTN